VADKILGPLEGWIKKFNKWFEEGKEEPKDALFSDFLDHVAKSGVKARARNLPSIRPVRPPKL
jgi:hypothetical protein